MGAWAEDTFGNDTACDWKHTFLEAPGLEPLREAIDAVLRENDYLDGDLACECLAACEVIARLQGRWGVRNTYSRKLDEWIETNPIAVPDRLKADADEAIERILGADSELQQLWDDGGRNENWHRAVDDLRERVRG